MITVTMPMREYEWTQAEIKELKQEHIKEFAIKDWTDIEKNEFNVIVDLGKIAKFYEIPKEKIIIKQD